MAEQLSLDLPREPITTKFYVHADRESSWDLAREIGLTGEAARNFSYTAYELELTLLVDPQSGKATITAVDGRKLAAK